MKNVIKTSLADQIYTILREDIINQRIKCGEKLTLKALQERFGTSSTPIREAIKRLNQEGLIENVTNVGAKVINIKANDIKEIYDFCSVLDVAALKMALENEKIDNMIQELDDAIKYQEISLKNSNINNFKIYSDKFHDVLYKYANNSRLYDASIKIRSQFTILANKYQNYKNAETTVLAEHKNILEAIKNKEIEKASSLMMQHFEHGKCYLLKSIEEGAYNISK